MAAGLSVTLWSMTDLAGMIDATLPKPGPRGLDKERELIGSRAWPMCEFGSTRLGWPPKNPDRTGPRAFRFCG